MLAGIACGIYRDCADAVQKMVQTDKEYKPDKDVSESYGRQKAMYRVLYPSLNKEIGKKLGNCANIFFHFSD